MRPVRLKAVIAEHPDWTQAKIAEAVGVSQQMVSNY
jgi:predicted transcriptional regulator